MKTMEARILEPDPATGMTTVMFLSGRGRGLASDLLVEKGRTTRGAPIRVTRLGQGRSWASGEFNFGILVEGVDADRIEEILQEEFAVSRWAPGTRWWECRE